LIIIQIYEQMLKLRYCIGTNNINFFIANSSFLEVDGIGSLPIPLLSHHHHLDSFTPLFQHELMGSINLYPHIRKLDNEA